MNGSKNYGTFTQWNSMQQKERRSSYPLQQHGWNWRVLHYGKWNKPGNERQIPYDLTFNWNLIDKMNKQAKYNQRYWNWEQADSDQRGEDNGGRGWSVYRNNYKGHVDNKKGGWKQGKELGRAEVVRRGREKRQKTVLEQQ